MKQLFESLQKRRNRATAEIMDQARGQYVVSWIEKILVHLAMLLAAGVVVLLVGYILVTGVPNLSLDLFAWKFSTDNQSMMPALINTLCITVLSLILAVPIGIGAAIYLAEYAKRGNKLVKLVRLTAETLSGIPSIVYGLFGMMFFNVALGWGYSMLAGSVTLAIMILPLILRTTEEALLSVPDSYREGSFGLGAGRLRTVFCAVLPSAVPGILSGVILAVGRVVSETAALLYTAGSTAKLPGSVFDSTRTLAMHMYVLSSEGLHINEAYATAAVLLIVVVLINACSNFLAGKVENQHAS